MNSRYAAIDDFDPEIREIEKEIASFFARKSGEFIGRHRHVSTILVYFNIRQLK